MSTPSEPNRPKAGDKTKRPVPGLKLTSRCPSCGRTGVVVFSLPPPADSPDDTARVVCIECCPRASDES